MAGGMARGWASSAGFVQPLTLGILTVLRVADCVVVIGQDGADEGWVCRSMPLQLSGMAERCKRGEGCAIVFFPFTLGGMRLEIW